MRLFCRRAVLALDVGVGEGGGALDDEHVEAELHARDEELGEARDADAAEDVVRDELHQRLEDRLAGEEEDRHDDGEVQHRHHGELHNTGGAG